MKLIIPPNLTPQELEDLLLPIIKDLASKCKAGNWEVLLRKYQRTNKQNRALHTYYRMVAESLNEVGHPFTYTAFKREIISPWSEDLVKEYIWKPLQQALVGSRTTTKLKTNEVNKVYDSIDQFLYSEFELSIPFPNKDFE